jgi:hypothetical protein
MAMFSISKQGLINERECPSQALDDTAGRRHAVVQALEILAPVVRPLAFEITLGPMDPETFAVTTVENRRLASNAIPAGVAHQSAFAHSAEVEFVDCLAPDAVIHALTSREAGWDFSTVVTLVTSARVYVSDLVLERMPSLPIPTLEADGSRWVVGPLDVPGYRLLPPIRLTCGRSGESCRWPSKRSGTCGGKPIRPSTRRCVPPSEPSMRQGSQFGNDPSMTDGGPWRRDARLCGP